MALTNAIDNLLIDGLQVQLSNSATGDIYYRDAAGNFTRLPLGAVGQYLGIVGGLPAWQALILALNSVSLGNLQQIGSSNLLGRSSAGNGSVEELTPAAVRLLLGLGSAALLAAGSAAGNVPVLDANGKLSSGVIPSLALTSIQQVANQTARLALTNVEPGDAAKETDTGLTYILSATPASTNSNWIAIGDTNIVASDIIAGLIATARLGNGTANSSSFLRGDQQWIPLGNLATFLWQAQTSSVTMTGNMGYLANSSTAGTPVVLTLPTTTSIGTVLQIVGVGVGGWRVAQGTGQQINFGQFASTAGTTGSLASTHFRNCVQLVATSTSTWQVVSSIGALDII